MAGARVLRGGSFRDFPGFTRCAFREASSPSSSYCHTGFRVAVGISR
jgi:formylglycine-generating enzyme required for sulfatase activity